MPRAPGSIRIAGNHNKIIIGEVCGDANVDLSLPDNANTAVCDDGNVDLSLPDNANTDSIDSGPAVCDDGDPDTGSPPRSPAVPIRTIIIAAAKRPLNSASLAELMKVGSIGDVLAKRIMEKRPYAQWADLKKRVDQIGTKRLDLLQERFTLEP